MLSWLHTVPAGSLVTYYAFTFPYTYTQLQAKLQSLDALFTTDPRSNDTPSPPTTAQPQLLQTNADQQSSAGASIPADIYYVRELVINSLDSHRLDLLTITSRFGQTDAREDKLPSLFPSPSQDRPFKFENKKIVFISARVHPGETPSSFVFNGFLDFIISNDPRASKLRDLYVFKLIPMLNPDGVVRGHYRTDQRGVNLNRVYGSPSADFHPTIYAARCLLFYYHTGDVSNTDSEESITSDSTATQSKAESSCLSPDAPAKTTVPEPPMLDEDTCHSFGDAGTCQEAKHLGKAAAGMELDEPSASGWDISSNISVDSSIHTSSMFRAPELSDIHDDCSNISGLSEAETGVTSMFGALAAVSTDTFDSYHNNLTKYEPSNTKETKWNIPVSETADVTCPKCLLPKKFSIPKCSCLGPMTRSVSKFSSTPLIKPLISISQQPALLTETNLKLHCSESFVAPGKSKPSLFSASAIGSSQPSDLLEGPPASAHGQPPSFGTSLLRESIGPFNFSLPSTLQPSFTFIQSSASIGSCLVPSASGGVTSLLSSSESEAEVGIPGREGLQVPIVTARPAHATAHCSSNHTATTPAPDKHGSSSSCLHIYVDLHGHASKRGEIMCYMAH